MDHRPAPYTHMAYADGMRVVAVLTIIALHSSAQGVIQYNAISQNNWWVCNSIDSLSRWAVPIFIMLSGALLLDPSKQESWSIFYKKRAKRILAPFIIWVSFYFFWTVYFYGEPVDKEFILKALFNGLMYNHLYFLFIIIGLYLVTPFFRIFVKCQKIFVLWGLAIGAFILATGDYFTIFLPFNASTRFIPYAGFFIAGFLLRQRMLSTGQCCAATLCFALSSAVIIIGTGQQVALLGIDDYRSFQYYDHFHLAVVIQSFSIFMILQYFMTTSLHPFLLKMFSIIGPVTFGVYLIHVMFLTLLKPYTKELFHQLSLAGIGIEVILTFFLSTVTCLLIARTPILRHAIGS